jgi:hypothetical protein
MPGTHPFPVDDERARLDRRRERFVAAELDELRDPQVGAQGDGEEQAPDVRTEPGNPRPEQLLDVVRDGQDLADRRLPALREDPADLEDEQGVAERRVEDPAQQRARRGPTRGGRRARAARPRG